MRNSKLACMISGGR